MATVIIWISDFRRWRLETFFSVASSILRPLGSFSMCYHSYSMCPNWTVSFSTALHPSRGAPERTSSRPSRVLYPAHAALHRPRRAQGSTWLHVLLHLPLRRVRSLRRLPRTPTCVGCHPITPSSRPLDTRGAEGWTSGDRDYVLSIKTILEVHWLQWKLKLNEQLWSPWSLTCSVLFLHKVIVTSYVTNQNDLIS